MATARNTKSRSSRTHKATEVEAAPAAEESAPKSSEASTPTEGGEADAETYQQRMRKLPAHLQIEAKVRAAYDRLGKLTDQIGDWVEQLGDDCPDDVAAMRTNGTAALEAMSALADACKEVGPEWKPPTKKRARKEIAAGTLVDIREKHLPKYEGHLEDEDLKGLKVTGSASGSLWLALNTDPTKEINVNRGHVQVAS